jgi:protein-ribulosamine 3-kinase
MEALRLGLSTALGIPVRDLVPISGGDINRAWRAELTDGGHCFLKSNRWELIDMFEAEADGLREIGATGAVRVPQPLASGTEGDVCFLALEWLDLEHRDRGSGATLGRALAALHSVSADRYGWHRDNTLGSSPQTNGWMDDWTGFWRERRLSPQLALAVGNGLGPELSEPGQRLMDALDQILAGYRPSASLLHGDLWGGNWGALPDGTPVIYDPATHYGDAECDLAMMALFGGFPAGCWDAYHEIRPRADGWERRRDLYQLHHVLNHANLFGGGYIAQAVAIMERLLGW